VKQLNPEGLHKNPAYSQAVVTTGNVRTVYVGGQNAVDASDKVIGRDDIRAQAQQIFKRTCRQRWRLGVRAWNTSSSGTSTSCKISRLCLPLKYFSECGVAGSTCR
jgi:hypothetical protein